MMEVLIAPSGFESNLALELRHIGLGEDDWEATGRLFLLKYLPRPVYWIENRWIKAEMLSIDSVSHAAKLLRARGGLWCAFQDNLFHRTGLIQEKLPRIKKQIVSFPPEVDPRLPCGAFALLDQHRMVCATSCSHPFHGGRVSIRENKKDPPGRAYLKLQELFLRLGTWPAPGAICIDAGASPGSWSWVLGDLGCRVVAIDRTELAPHIQKNSNIQFKRGDAFSVQPYELHEGPIDWLFCDVIAPPGKLYDWILPWVESGGARNIVCTLKMQGQPDLKTTDLFAAIPNAQILHLDHNKHELTCAILHPNRNGTS